MSPNTQAADPKQAAYEVFAARLGNCTSREEALAKQGFLCGWDASAMRDPLAAEVIATARVWRSSWREWADTTDKIPDCDQPLVRAVDAYEAAIGGRE